MSRLLGMWQRELDGVARRYVRGFDRNGLGEYAAADAIALGAGTTGIDPMTWERLLVSGLSELDVVRVRLTEDRLRSVVRFELRDGRWLDIELSPPDVATRNAAHFMDMLYSRARPILKRGFRRCMDHEDCRSLKKLGEACWRDRYEKTA